MSCGRSVGASPSAPGARPSQSGMTVRSATWGAWLCAAAAPLYELLGESSLRPTTLPEPNPPIQKTLGYNKHAGGHGILPGDWPVYLRFMRKHFLGEE